MRFVGQVLTVGSGSGTPPVSTSRLLPTIELCADIEVAGDLRVNTTQRLCGRSIANPPLYFH
jgi:hypothetical protein